MKKTVAFTALAIFFFVLLLETFCGIIILSSHHFFGTPKRISVFWPHPLLTGRNIARYEMDWSQAYPVFSFRPRIHMSNECGYTTDRYGFIHNGDETREIKKNNFTIFITGGSTVAGHGIACNDQSISAQLENLLRKRYQNVDVINAGVPAYYSPLEFLKISNEILFYEPDLIISFNGYNDFRKELEEYKGRKNAYFVGAYHKTLYETLDNTDSLWWSLKNIFWNMTKFTEFTYTRFVIEKGSNFISHRLSNSSKDDFTSNIKKTVGVRELPKRAVVYNDDFYELLDRKISYYLSYIRETHALVTGLGIKYYFILQPSLLSERGDFNKNVTAAREITRYGFWKKGEGDLLARSGYFWDKVDEAMVGTNLRYVNFRDIFDDAQEAYSDYIHYTSYGNSVIAENIYQQLIKDEIIPEGYLRNQH